MVKDLAVLTVLISLFFGTFLGTRPLSVPDEGRYAEIPREMVESGDFVTPRLNGVKYFEKPPLMYWLTSTSIKAFDMNEGALRFWPAIFALFGCLATYLFGRRFYDRQTGITSALILATSLLYYAHSRILILDMPVSVLITSALFSFFTALFEKNRIRKRFFLTGFFVFSAGALMTKGLLGIALPGGIILLWALYYKRWGPYYKRRGPYYKRREPLKLAFNPWGILLFLALSLPWHILASLRNPEFFDFYIIHEQILRFLTTVHKRSQPFWFFIPIIFFGLFPWIVFLHKTTLETYQSIKSKTKTHLTDVFLVTWIIFIFLFFSASSSKLIPYILPVFPAFALLLGRTISKAWSDNNITVHTLGIRFFQALAVLLIIAAPLALYIKKQLGNTLITPYVALAVMSLFIGLIFTFIYQRKHNMRALILTIGLSSIFMYIPFNKAWVHLERRSIYPLAKELKNRLEKDDLVISWHRYYQDLPPYIGRTTYVVEYLTEMAFGASVEDVTSWMLSEQGFEEIIKSGKPFYIVTRISFMKEMQQRYPALKNLQIIARSGKDILLTNK